MKFKISNSALFLLLFFAGIGFNSNSVKAQSNEPYVLVEQMPEFAGGEEKMYQFISSNINYPAYCKENNIVGRVIARFIVTNKGEIDSVNILASPHQTMSDECIRMIKLMPIWTPGKQNGKPVNVFFTLPISFQLETSTPKKRK